MRAYSKSPRKIKQGLQIEHRYCFLASTVPSKQTDSMTQEVLSFSPFKKWPPDLQTSEDKDKKPPENMPIKKRLTMAPSIFLLKHASLHQQSMQSIPLAVPAHIIVKMPALRKIISIFFFFFIYSNISFI